MADSQAAPGPEVWAAVDGYIADTLVTPDAALDGALEASRLAGLPAIHVAANQGRLLGLLALIHGSRSILEIGTLGGYSTIWLARSLPPDGRLTTLEVNPDYAAVARTNLDRAGVSHLVDIRVGRAADSLAQLGAEGAGPFDMVFIDADKPSTALYFEWAMRLARRGSLIVVDNVVRGGALADPETVDAGAQGIRRFFQVVAGDPRVSATAIQTVGAKGYDGFAIMLVTEDP